MTRTVAGYTCWGNVNDSWLKISLKERHEGSLQLCTCSAPALKLGRRKKEKTEIEKWCCVGFTRALVVRQMTATHNLSSLVSLLEWGHRSWRRAVFSHTNEPLLRPLLMLCVCVRIIVLSNSPVSQTIVANAFVLWSACLFFFLLWVLCLQHAAFLHGQMWVMSLFSLLFLAEFCKLCFSGSSPQRCLWHWIVVDLLVRPRNSKRLIRLTPGRCLLVGETGEARLTSSYVNSTSSLCKDSKR